MDLIYLRHGKTDWNDRGLLQGRTDIPLNEEGLAQAKAAGEILKNYTFDAVYCSPLSRAVQTLAMAYPTDSFVTDARLAEWSFGVLEGKCVSEEYFRSFWSFGQEPLEDGESIEDVVARVFDFYNEIKAKHPDGRVLVVSHGGVSGAMHAAVCGISPDENLRKYCLPNAVPVLFRAGSEPVLLTEDFYD